MYLKFSFENLITIGVMLAVWMLAIHALAQVGIRLPSFLSAGQ